MVKVRTRTVLLRQQKRFGGVSEGQKETCSFWRANEGAEQSGAISYTGVIRVCFFDLVRYHPFFDILFCM